MRQKIFHIRRAFSFEEGIKTYCEQKVAYGDLAVNPNYEHHSNCEACIAKYEQEALLYDQQVGGVNS